MALIPCVVAGCGPGALRWVTPEVRQAASACELLAGAPTLLELFPESPAERLAYDQGLTAFLEALRLHLGQRRVTVLVSGDPGLASLATTLARHFPDQPFRRLPGLSSVQVAFAECGLDHSEACILRAHQNLPPWDPRWEGHQGPFAVLTGHPEAPSYTAALARRLGRPWIWRCERLGRPNERVERLSPERLDQEGCDASSVLIVEGETP